MKILIINPNSSEEMTQAIQHVAEFYAGDSLKVSTHSTPGAPEFIETYEDQIKAVEGMLQLVRDFENEVDGFVVACHCDPNLDTMKEVSVKPVVGIGEASMKMATMLGHCFSVLSTASHSVPNKEALVHKYHLQDLCASVRAPENSLKDCGDVEILTELGQKAIQEDGAEVLVLGCAGMAGVDKTLQKKLGVPVLDGVVCALILVSGMIQYGVSTSKVRRYNPVC